MIRWLLAHGWHVFLAADGLLLAALIVASVRSARDERRNGARL
jgi:hypothetical protein